jgi:hypothetical protein
MCREGGADLAYTEMVSAAAAAKGSISMRAIIRHTIRFISHFLSDN